MEYENKYPFTINEIYQLDINKIYKLWLMASFLYYEMDVNIITDEEFDKLSMYLLDNYDKITDKYKYLIDENNLSCGSGYDIKYPTIIKHLALDWYSVYTRR